MTSSQEGSLYEKIGGEQTISRLVKAFYPRVVKDPDLSPLFITDIEEIMRKQQMFLTQLLGGPSLYSMEFGPPMLRARHLPFEITPRRAEAWLKCMGEAMNEVELEGAIREFLFQRLTQVAHHMVNS